MRSKCRFNADANTGHAFAIFMPSAGDHRAPALVNLGVTKSPQPLMKTLFLEAFRSKEFETVVFAGGGNRRWRQAGLVEGFSGSALWTPTTFVSAAIAE